MVDEQPRFNWFAGGKCGDDASVLLREMGLVAMGYLGGLHELACIKLRPMGADVTCFDVSKEMPYWGGEQSCNIGIATRPCEERKAISDPHPFKQNKTFFSF